MKEKLNYYRNCPNCNIELIYKCKINFKQAEKENRFCYDCKMKQKSDLTKSIIWKRNCSTCNIEIIYKEKGNFKMAEKRNSTCLKCTKNEKRNNTEFFKECPNCNSIIFYKNQVSLDDSLKNNSKCKKCVSKNASIYQKEHGGNKGMLIEKYGYELGIEKFKEAEVKRIKSFNEYWENNSEQYNNLIEKRTSFKCKFFYINGIKCQGNSEKYFIENSKIKNIKKCKGIKTPIGYYFPDFEVDDYYIEIKSEYTYKILKQKDNLQY